MAEYVKGLFGGSKPSPSPASEDADFADFAGAPDPSPLSVVPDPASSTGSAQSALPTSATPIIYTKWYRVWERASPRDFYQEAIIIPFIIIICSLHFWGRRTNRRKAKDCMRTYGPELEKEYAVVGFSGKKTPSIDDVQSDGLLKAMAAASNTAPPDLLKEKTAQEFLSYASGRQNVAFTDFKILLLKRYNPMTLLVEWLLSFFFESQRAPSERIELTTYTFDGREKDLVPKAPFGDGTVKAGNSTYDGFVWAVVHKEEMKYLRDDRYDLSLTFTKDHAKLPPWATVMSESSEITEQFLTPDLLKAIEKAGDSFSHLIVSDQPLDKPNKLDDTTPKKRISLSFKLPSSFSNPSAYEHTLPIFQAFLRLPDVLVSNAHFRGEVTRKIRATREAEINKIKRVGDKEKADERKVEEEKRKKEMRDNKLKGMSADEQRKYLEKERGKGQKKQQKRMSVKA